jgi:hypothetical protein
MCLDQGQQLPAGTFQSVTSWTQAHRQVEGEHHVAATTDANGMVEINLIHGEYNFTVSHPSTQGTRAVHAVTIAIVVSTRADYRYQSVGTIGMGKK